MRIAGFILVLLVVLWLVFLQSWDAGAGGADGGEVGSSRESAPPEVPNAPEEPKAGIRLIDGNPLIVEFGAEAGSLQRDLEALRDVVRDCQLIIKDFDRFHLPGNPEIVRFLQGGNPDRLAWLPRDFSFVNDKGELLDRHGNPIFFHRLSGRRFEYRSAGPDRELWTADDVIVK